MEHQIGTALHWSNQKEPEQTKRKDEVIRRNLDRIHISAATPLPSDYPSRHSQVSLIQKIYIKKTKKSPDQKKKFGGLPDHASDQVEILNMCFPSLLDRKFEV